MRDPFSVEAWKQAVANNKTTYGYEMWATLQREYAKITLPGDA